MAKPVIYFDYNGVLATKICDNQVKFLTAAKKCGIKQLFLFQEHKDGNFPTISNFKDLLKPLTIN